MEVEAEVGPSPGLHVAVPMRGVVVVNNLRGCDKVRFSALPIERDTHATLYGLWLGCSVSGLPSDIAGATVRILVVPATDVEFRLLVP